MRTTTRKVEKHRQGYDRIEIYVDEDLFKIIEEYKDDEGNVVYVYEYYPTTGELFKHQNKKENKKDVKKKNKNRKRTRR
jgi:hypothetical protein